MKIQVYRNKNILQLYMVRTMLESVLTEKSGSAKKSFRKDIDTQHLRVIETFHKNSFFWKYMLNLNGNTFICMRFWQSSNYSLLCCAQQSNGLNCSFYYRTFYRKVRKRAKIRNRYNQAPHLKQDTKILNWKVTTSQLDIKNES